MFALSLVCLLSTHESSAAIAQEQAQAQLQGTWQFVLYLEDGVRGTKDGMKYSQLVISGDKLIVNKTLEVKDGNKPPEFSAGGCAAGTVRVDPSTNPKKIEIVGDHEAWSGIYDLEGEVLKICVSAVGEPRPTTFDAAQGTRRALLKVRKVKGRFDDLLNK